MTTRQGRRELMLALLAGGGVTLASAAWLAARRQREEGHGAAPVADAGAPAPTSNGPAAQAARAPFTPAQRALLDAAQERLLPSEPQAPGARDVHALAYLEGALVDPHAAASDTALLASGADALEARARAQHAASFTALSAATQDELLRGWQAEERGAEWLGTLLSYTLEALLGDPCYGGNPEGSGWRWLEVPAPFPRPPRPFASEEP